MSTLVINIHATPLVKVTKHDPSLQWRHNEREGVTNHRRIDCLLNCLFRRRSKKTPKIRVTRLCEGIRRWLVDSPRKGPVMRIIFPFDDIIIYGALYCMISPKYFWSEWLRYVGSNVNENRFHKHTLLSVPWQQRFKVTFQIGFFRTLIFPVSIKLFFKSNTIIVPVPLIWS